MKPEDELDAICQWTRDRDTGFHRSDKSTTWAPAGISENDFGLPCRPTLRGLDTLDLGLLEVGFFWIPEVAAMLDFALRLLILIYW